MVNIVLRIWRKLQNSFIRNKYCVYYGKSVGSSENVLNPDMILWTGTEIQ